MFYFRHFQKLDQNMYVDKNGINNRKLNTPNPAMGGMLVQ